MVTGRRRPGRPRGGGRRTLTGRRERNTHNTIVVDSRIQQAPFHVGLSWFLPRLVEVGAGVVSPQQLVVIDTDPGIDDATAILTTLGNSDANVLAITCVRGNTDAPNVVMNTLKILTVAQKLQIKVFTGFNFGLVESPAITDYFGKDGLGDLPFNNPPSPTIVQKELAASFLARIVKEYPGLITVIAIGPLTNLALALHLNPQFLQQARRVVILGGSVRGLGNVSPGLEFNFHMDPDAANLVLNRATESQTLVTLVPMETCLDNDLGKEWRWKKLANIDNSVVSFLNKLDQKNLEMHPSPLYIPYDMYAAAVALCPDAVILSREYFGAVEKEGQKLKGALVMDYCNLTQDSANLEVILEVNTTAIKQYMIKTLSNYI